MHDMMRLQFLPYEYVLVNNQCLLVPHLICEFACLLNSFLSCTCLSNPFISGPLNKLIRPRPFVEKNKTTRFVFVVNIECSYLMMMCEGTPIARANGLAVAAWVA